MITIIRTGLLALFVALTSSAALADGAVLTVSGQIEKTNRGPSDSFSDALFKALDVQFAKAYEFSLADLVALPQKTLKTAYPNWPGEAVVVGPTLSDVLSHVGATGKTVGVRAVDGYAPEFSSVGHRREQLHSRDQGERQNARCRWKRSGLAGVPTGQL